MDTRTLADFQRDLSSITDRVIHHRQPVAVANESGTAVLIPLDEYTSLLETLHLLGSPKNAERLRNSINQLNRK